jgi:hypothetical protein
VWRWFMQNPEVVTALDRVDLRQVSVPAQRAVGLLLPFRLGQAPGQAPRRLEHLETRLSRVSLGSARMRGEPADRHTSLEREERRQQN